MFKESKKTFSPTNYSPDTIATLGDIPADQITFDFVEHNGREALVIDATGVNENDVESWVRDLKHTASVGSIYAHDHRKEGEVPEGAPEISVMFEGISSLDDVSDLANQLAEKTPEMVRSAINALRTNVAEEQDKLASDARLAASAKLLQFANAF